MVKKIVSTVFALAAVVLLSANANAWRGDMSGNSTMMNRDMHHEMHQEMHQNMTQNMNQDQMGNMAGEHHMNRANFRSGLGPQHYPPFDVDISDDVFVNPHRYMEFTGGGQFVDENGDGICDIAQDTEMFRQLGVGPCVDENGDTICDCFQTRDAYKRMGMKNFVDVDGDGICDNYELNPMAGQDDDSGN